MLQMDTVAPYGSAVLSRHERQVYRRIFKIDGSNSVLAGVLLDRLIETYANVLEKEGVWFDQIVQGCGFTRKSILFTNFSSLIAVYGFLLGEVGQVSVWVAGHRECTDPVPVQKRVADAVKFLRMTLLQLDDGRRLHRLDQVAALIGHTVTQEYHTLFTPPTRKLESLENFARTLQGRIAWMKLVLERKEGLLDISEFPIEKTAEELAGTMTRLQRWPSSAKGIFSLCLDSPPRLYGKMVDLVDPRYKDFAFGAIWGPLRYTLIEGLTLPLAHLLEKARDSETRFQRLLKVHSDLDEIIRSPLIIVVPPKALERQWSSQDREQIAKLLEDQQTDMKIVKSLRPIGSELVELFKHKKPTVRALPLARIVFRCLPHGDTRQLLAQYDLQLIEDAQDCSEQVKTWTMWRVWTTQFRLNAIAAGRVRIREDMLAWFDDVNKPVEFKETARPVRRRQVQRPRKKSPPKPKQKEPAPQPKVGKIVPPTENLLEALPVLERLATERMQAVGQHVESLDAVAGYRLRLLLVQAREILQHDLGRHYEVDTCRRALELLLKALLPKDFDQYDALLHTHHLKDLLGAIVDYPELASNLLQGLKHYGWLFAALSNANAALFYRDIVRDHTTLELIRYIDSEGPASYLEHTLCAVEELLHARNDPAWTGKWTDREIPAMTVSEFDVEEEGESVSTSATASTTEEFVETPLDAAQKCLLYVRLRQLTYPQPALDRASTYLGSLIERIQQSNRGEMLLYTVCGELSLIRRLLKEVQVAALDYRGQLTDELRKKNNPLVLSQHLPNSSLGGLKWLAAVHQGIHYPHPRDGSESHFHEHLCQIADTALAGHGFTPAGGRSPKELIEVTDRKYLFPALRALLRLLRAGFSFENI